MLRRLTGAVWLAVASALALTMPLASLAAQRPVSIGLAGGVSVPTEQLHDGVDTGWNALGTLVLSTLMQPLGLRLDVAYNRFASSSQEPPATDGAGHLSVGSATLNATYRLPATRSPMSPYLISGLGAYRTECSPSEVCGATTRYGWNVGLGTKLTGFGLRSFLEARYHRTTRGDANVHYVPVTFGLLF